MSLTDERKPNYRHRIIWLGIFVVVLFGGYSAGWFYVAGKLEELADAGDRQAQPRRRLRPIAPIWRPAVSRSASASTATASALKTRRNRSRPRPAAFRSLAQVYDPFRIVAELDSPAQISVPGGGAFGFNWDNLRASARLSMDFPELVSVEVKSLTADANLDASPATRLVSAGAAEAHMRKSGDDLDLAASFTDADIDPKLLNGGDLPPLQGEADLTIKDGVNLVRFGDGSLRGHSGTIRTLAVSSSEKAGLSLAGPFSVAADGLVDADLTVTIRDPKALVGDAGPGVPRSGRADQDELCRPRSDGRQSDAAAEGQQGPRHARLHPAREICRCMAHDFRMLDRLPAEIRRVDFLAGLDDRAADRAGAGEQVEQLVAVAPADRPLQRGQVFRKPRQHFEDGVLVVQADVAPHGRVGGGKAREIAKARGRVFDDLGLGHRLQIVGRADDVVGDDVRQMRDDGQHHVVVLRDPSCRCWSRSAARIPTAFPAPPGRCRAAA